MKSIFFLICLVTIAFCIGCTKFVEVDPPLTNPVSSSVFSNNQTSAAVLTGVYTRMIENSSGFSSGKNSISALSSLAADELTNFSTNPLLTQIFKNSLQSSNAPTFWVELYQFIYVVNKVVEGLSGNTAVSESVKRQLIGEAKFLRAFFYFQLVNIYGDVPLLLTSDYRVNSFPLRSPQVQLYQQIISDLQDAKNLLIENYISADGVTSTTDRVRPNRWVATALLAKVYLYLNDWVKAETEATSVINQVDTYILVSNLNDVFLKDSKEAIWQLQPVFQGFNTFDGFAFILSLNFPPPAFEISPFTVSPQLYNEFEFGDKRKENWIGSKIINAQPYYFPYKYKVFTGADVTEYLMVFRLAEQYLIRSEARLRQNNIVGGISDLNVLRDRARDTVSMDFPNPLPALSFNLSKDEALDAVAHERQVELFTEWGNRWFDLKRTGKINSVMDGIAVQKGGSWQSTDTLYPIPQQEILLNKNLVQNPGYQ